MLTGPRMCASIDVGMRVCERLRSPTGTLAGRERRHLHHQPQPDMG